jgi:hypothetical protein
MLKELRARQESVAINNIKNNSTLSAGRIRANRAYEETTDRSYSSPIHNYDWDDDESGGKDDKIWSYRGERRLILASSRTGY